MGTTKKRIKWFGMKLTPEEKQKIEKLAKRRGVSQKKAVMDLVEKEIDEEREPIKAEPGSFLDRNRDLCGIGSGSGDVSTNPEYMEGYGR